MPTTALTIVVLSILTQAPAASPPGESSSGGWPRFHGPRQNGQYEGPSLPLRWSEEENVVWKTAIHGRGWSSPVVLGDQIWMTTANDDGTRMYAVCVDRVSGRIVHDILVFDDQTPTDVLLTNSFASPTPCVVPGHVYVHFGAYGTACLDTETGSLIWQRRDLNCDHLRGPGSSPLLHEDRLYLTFDGADLQYTACLDRRTGQTLWKTDRSTDFGQMEGDLRKAYCTPILIRSGDEQQLVSTGAQATFAYDPTTGEELWTVRYQGFSNASRPVFDGKRLYIGTGFARSTLLAIEPAGRGDLTDTRVVWTNTRGAPLKPTPVVVNGRLYCVDDNGVLTALDTETGTIVWQERIGGNFSASPLVDGDTIYFTDERGRTTVIRAGDRFEVLAENMLDEGCMASPAAVDGSLFLRAKTHLYRIENR